MKDNRGILIGTTIFIAVTLSFILLAPKYKQEPEVVETTETTTEETTVVTTIETTETTTEETTIDIYAEYEYKYSLDKVYECQEINSDVKGWIYIPGAYVDSPIVQTEDNDYYLEHNWKKGESHSGAIMLDYRCNINSTYGKNNIIYGHNMANGTMFAGLKNYMSESFWREHKTVEIYTDKEIRLYEVYACSDVNGNGNTDFKYWADEYLYISSDEKLKEHTSKVKKHDYYETYSEPEYAQDIITLQTCRGFDGMRTLVFAKRVK